MGNNNTNELCACGCGIRTSICTRTNISRGEVKGVHRKYIKGHNSKGRNLKGYQKRNENTGYDKYYERFGNPVHIKSLMSNKIEDNF